MSQTAANLIDINQVDYEIKEGILRVADVPSAFRFEKPRTRRNVWFDSECKREKSNYKKVGRNTKDVGIKESALKQYKVLLQEKRVSYFNKFNKDLFRLRTKSPKEFWALLKFSMGRKTNVKFELKPMFEHFQKLNILPSLYSEDEIQEIDVPENPVISCDFCFEEVQHAINKLSNGKAAGLDNVFPEFIKSAPRCMIELFTDFFNFILASGTVPDDWSLSIICPI